LTKDFHPNARSISCNALEILEASDRVNEVDAFFNSLKPHDIPGDWFKGPF